MLFHVFKWYTVIVKLILVKENVGAINSFDWISTSYVLLWIQPINLNVTNVCDSLTNELRNSDHELKNNFVAGNYMKFVIVFAVIKKI